MSEQASRILRKRIDCGDYPADKRMPSEENLAKELGVSRATIRSALAGLEAEGLVARRQGDGTYAADRTLAFGVGRDGRWEFERRLSGDGHSVTLELLESARRPPRPTWIGTAADLWYRRILFRADGAPAGLVDTWMNHSLDDVADDESLLPPMEFVERRLSGQAAKAEARFLALPAEPEIARLMELRPGAPLLVLSASILDASGSSLIESEERYPGSLGFSLPSTRFAR